MHWAGLASAAVVSVSGTQVESHGSSPFAWLSNWLSQ